MYEHRSKSIPTSPLDATQFIHMLVNLKYKTCSFLHTYLYVQVSENDLDYWLVTPSLLGWTSMNCVELAYAERVPEHRRYYNGVTDSLGILKRSNLYYCLLHRANSQLTARDTTRNVRETRWNEFSTRMRFFHRLTFVSSSSQRGRAWHGSRMYLQIIPWQIKHFIQTNSHHWETGWNSR